MVSASCRRRTCRSVDSMAGLDLHTNSSHSSSSGVSPDTRSESDADTASLFSAAWRRRSCRRGAAAGRGRAARQARTPTARHACVTGSAPSADIRQDNGMGARFVGTTAAVRRRAGGCKVPAFLPTSYEQGCTRNAPQCGSAGMRGQMGCSRLHHAHTAGRRLSQPSIQYTRERR